MAERSSPTFFKNLALSQAKEREFESILASRYGLNTHNTQDLGSFSPYDVGAWTSSQPLTKYELKLEKLASSTGNIAVERFKIIDGEKQPSGLSATQADWYVYTFPDDHNFYLISTRRLRQMVEEIPHRVTTGGNGGYFILSLFPKDVFLKECSIL